MIVFAALPVDVDCALDEVDDDEHPAKETTAQTSASRDRASERSIDTRSTPSGVASLSPSEAPNMKYVRPWTIAATVIAAVLLVAAVSHSVYEITSPVWFEWHVVLRKIYSVGAFTLVAYALRRALVENGRTSVVLPCILWLAAYSAAIEVLQFAYGSEEGLGWNTIDTLCGALGGALATIDLWSRRSATTP